MTDSESDERLSRAQGPPISVNFKRKVTKELFLLPCRLTTTTDCEGGLGFFPMERHVCRLDIESCKNHTFDTSLPFPLLLIVCFLDCQSSDQTWPLPSSLPLLSSSDFHLSQFESSLSLTSYASSYILFPILCRWVSNFRYSLQMGIGRNTSRRCRYHLTILWSYLHYWLWIWIWTDYWKLFSYRRQVYHWASVEWILLPRLPPLDHDRHHIIPSLLFKLQTSVCKTHSLNYSFRPLHVN